MMTESIRRGNAEILYDQPDGVMVYDRRAQSYMLAAAAENAVHAMIAQITDPHLLVAHDPMSRACLAERFHFPEILAVRQAAYLKKEIAVPQADIRPLDMRFHGFIRAHYKSVDDDAYIRRRIEEGEMLGIFQDGALAGFIGTHDEGSLGLLEILPEYRRRGLAEALERHMTRVHLLRGWVPFAQIENDNLPSQALHKKIGFTLSEDSLYWFM